MQLNPEERKKKISHPLCVWGGQNLIDRLAHVIETADIIRGEAWTRRQSDKILPQELDHHILIVITYITLISNNKTWNNHLGTPFYILWQSRLFIIRWNFFDNKGHETNTSAEDYIIHREMYRYTLYKYLTILGLQKFANDKEEEVIG